MALSLPALIALAHACAPTVAPATLLSVARAESAFDPLTIGVNTRPHRSLHPATVREAVKQASALAARGVDFDVGLAQINARTLPRLGLDLTDAFDPCRNLAAGAQVLTRDYLAASAGAVEPQAALRAATTPATPNAVCATVTSRRSTSRPLKSCPRSPWRGGRRRGPSPLRSTPCGSGPRSTPRRHDRRSASTCSRVARPRWSGRPRRVSRPPPRHPHLTANPESPHPAGAPAGGAGSYLQRSGQVAGSRDGAGRRRSRPAAARSGASGESLRRRASRVQEHDTVKLTLASILTLVLLGCSKSEQTSSNTPFSAEQVAERCRSGEERGDQCSGADRALSEKEHHEAQSAFRSMGGTR